MEGRWANPISEAVYAGPERIRARRLPQRAFVETPPAAFFSRQPV
jgi:hypothetical protein